MIGLKRNMLFLGVVTLFTIGCDTEEKDVTPSVTAPESYVFERDGSSTVSYSGQTDRIAMATELASAMTDVDGASQENLLAMFRNEGPNGEDVSPFESAELNSSTKSIKSKVASSKDFFSANTTEAALYKNAFESMIAAQVTEIFPAWETLAAKGMAGQIADGSSTRFVSAKGLEYNQLLAKGLIGALMLDQINNNYLSNAVLDEADNRANNDAEVLEDGKTYTSMEHKWDEAYGYLFGASADGENPLNTLGSDDAFLNKYLGRVEDDSDFAGIAKEIFDAFKLGRAAIVAKNYTLRDEQAESIRENLSKVIGIRAVYYLQSGKNAISNGNYGSAFHDLSEGFGFVTSLRYTRKPNSSEPYLSAEEINTIVIEGLESENGFWELTPEFLDQASAQIASAFGFEVSSTIN